MGEYVNWIDFVILFLAVFRLTHLIVFDRLFDRVRNIFVEIIEEIQDDGEVYQYIESKGRGLRKLIGNVISCYWCTGVWVSIFLVIAFVFLYQIIWIPLLIFAISGAAGIIESMLRK
ncbi:DUF1360 domain-containing protein [Alkalihalophilus marmarensis]|jgi:hypothetical protein|uniref:Sporulation protein YjcA n=1 Tax=Alkalihalophilus marmarensis DSM 21297 TaxID=1188261 RepID=U6SND8_9BACI|nr:DUF1360 domain-containing protein [Alkalihalophilus marmarensis]ERN52872.1 hypothetical protein A33I_14410 [Alkalihalophilus marmarensis DSM 21297]MCM3489126.1 DUF1360 domain-containing protein [Alkalihalophilus marmarensis]